MKKALLLLTYFYQSLSLCSQAYHVESFQDEYQEIEEYTSLMLENGGSSYWEKRFDLDFGFPFFNVNYNYINCFSGADCYFDDDVDYSMRLLEFGYECDIIQDTSYIPSDIRYAYKIKNGFKCLVVQWTKNRLISDPTIESHDSYVNFQYWFFENGTIEVRIGPSNISNSPVYVPGEGFYLLTQQGSFLSGPHIAIYHPFNRDMAYIYDDIDSLQNFQIVYHDTLPGSVSWWPPEGWVIRFNNLLVSTKDNSLQDKVHVSPNPTSEKIRISSEYTIKSSSLYNINGTLIMQLKSEQFQEMDISGFPCGTYFLRLHTDNHVVTKKIIKI